MRYNINAVRKTKGTPQNGYAQILYFCNRHHLVVGAITELLSLIRISKRKI
jgi:hypothetical protein